MNYKNNNNNNNNINNNDNDSKYDKSFYTKEENRAGVLWINKTKNRGDYFKGKIKAMDANGDFIKGEDGRPIEHSIIIFYNKFNSKIKDPTMIIYKPDRSKWEGKDYDKYKKKLKKEIEIKDNAIKNSNNNSNINKNDNKNKKIKRNEDKLKEIDI